MKNNFAIDIKQFTSVLINVLCVKILFTFPKRLIITSGNAAWIQMLFLTVLMLVFFNFLIKAYAESPGLDLIDLSEKAGGKWLKYFVGLWVSFALFLNLASVIRGYPDMVKMVLLPDTPIEIILLVFAVVTAIAVYFGFEAIVRIHSIYIPFFIGIFCIFFLFLLPHTNIYNIFPILGKGGMNVFVRGLESIDFFDDLLLLGLFMPYVRDINEARRGGFRAIAVSGGLAVVGILLYTLIYPYPSSQKFIVPVYQLTRLVGIGDFFQRFEAFFEFVWSISVFLYASVYMLFLCMVWKKSFNLKYERPIIFPLIATATIFSYTSQNLQDIVFNYWYLTVFMLFTVFVLPIILSFAYNKKRKITSHKKEQEV